MVAFTTIAAVVLGLGALWGAFSLVSFVAHWAAVAGGIAVFYNVLKYLIDARPVELFDHEALDNLSYLAAAVPAGLLGFRLMEAVFTGIGVLALLLVVGVIVLMAVLGPMTVIGYAASIMQLMGGEGE